MVIEAKMFKHFAPGLNADAVDDRDGGGVGCQPNFSAGFLGGRAVSTGRLFTGTMASHIGVLTELVGGHHGWRSRLELGGQANGL
jgi:hypothetical protein